MLKHLMNEMREEAGIEQLDEIKFPVKPETKARMKKLQDALDSKSGEDVAHFILFDYVDKLAGPGASRAFAAARMGDSERRKKMIAALGKSGNDVLVHLSRFVDAFVRENS